MILAAAAAFWRSGYLTIARFPFRGGKGVQGERVDLPHLVGQCPVYPAVTRNQHFIGEGLTDDGDFEVRLRAGRNIVQVAFISTRSKSASNACASFVSMMA